jgi:4-aminobutyrate aminotransferase-like enzyme
VKVLTIITINIIEHVDAFLKKRLSKMNNRETIKKYRTLNTGEVAMAICINKVENNTLYDNENVSYIDFTSGFGVTNVGWQRNEVIDAIKNQLDKLTYSPPWLPTNEAVELSELLLSIVPSNVYKCSRATGGAEANETILKASFALNRKSGILSLFRSYHGGSKFTVNMSDVEKFKLPKLPTSNNYHKAPTPYCFRCPFDKKPDSCNVECGLIVEDIIKKNPDIGIFYMEPVIGSGGVIVPPQKYFNIVQDICNRYNVTFVFDEVITGFGRLGTLTGMDAFNIFPDAVSFGKGMGGGFIPIGASLMKNELAEIFTNIEDVSATFAWTPIACVAAKANIELMIRENLAKHAQIKGVYIKEQIHFLFEKYLPENLGEVRGMGLLIGVELIENQISRKPVPHRLMQTLTYGLIRNGLMVCTSWDFQVIIFMPPLNISDTDVNKALNILESQLQLFSKIKKK